MKTFILFGRDYKKELYELKRKYAYDIEWSRAIVKNLLEHGSSETATQFIQEIEIFLNKHYRQEDKNG